MAAPQSRIRRQGHNAGLAGDMANNPMHLRYRDGSGRVEIIPSPDAFDIDHPDSQASDKRTIRTDDCGKIACAFAGILVVKALALSILHERFLALRSLPFEKPPSLRFTLPPQRLSLGSPDSDRLVDRNSPMHHGDDDRKQVPSAVPLAFQRDRLSSSAIEDFRSSSAAR